MSSGTPSLDIPGWYINFQAAVLKQLPRPSQIDQTTAVAWEHNQASLQKALAGALIPPLTLSQCFEPAPAATIAEGPKKFGVWKTIRIGGVKTPDLLVKVTALALAQSRDLMGKPEFTTLASEEEIDLIVLTPRDFGFKKNQPTAILLDPKLLLEWSGENLDGYVIELCPAEVGPHLRLQYTDQPNGEILWIAMERITAFDGRPGLFGVGRDRAGLERDGNGGYWFDTDWLLSDDEWSLDDRIVFRLRKIQG